MNPLFCLAVALASAAAPSVAPVENGGWELIYDAATGSESALRTCAMGSVFGALALAWGLWLKIRGHALHGGVKMCGLIAIVLALVGGLARYEQTTFATRPDRKTVEGVVAGYWTDRQRDANNSYRVWEGFWVNGVSFVYAPGVDQNFFHESQVLRDGMLVRLVYVGSRNDIIRVEKKLP